MWSLDAVDIRAFATDKHRTVDDTPAGGGPGMVMKPDVLAARIDATATDERPRLLLCAARPAADAGARRRRSRAAPASSSSAGASKASTSALSPRARLEEVSIGDYVLSGGEVAAMVLVDACVRLLPGVMGAAASGAEESFADGLLEYPQYTRPQLWEGRPIPEVLLSGDHGKDRRLAARRGRTAHPRAPARPLGGVHQAFWRRLAETAMTGR